MDPVIISLIIGVVVILVWARWVTGSCLGFHDWDRKRGEFTEACRRCGAKRFK